MDALENTKNIIQKYGFEIADHQRVISGVLINENYSFRLFIDMLEKKVSLVVVHEVMERSLFHQQNFYDEKGLEFLLSGSSVLTRFGRVNVV